jgi:hypothetical protein
LITPLSVFILVAGLILLFLLRDPDVVPSLANDFTFVFCWSNGIYVVSIIVGISVGYFAYKEFALKVEIFERIRLGNSHYISQTYIAVSVASFLLVFILLLIFGVMLFFLDGWTLCSRGDLENISNLGSLGIALSTGSLLKWCLYSLIIESLYGSICGALSLTLMRYIPYLYVGVIGPSLLVYFASYVLSIYSLNYLSLAKIAKFRVDSQASELVLIYSISVVFVYLVMAFFVYKYKNNRE